MVESHPIQRAKDRYGVDLDTWDLCQIRSEIARGNTVLLGTCPDRGTQTHLIKYKDTVMKVIYSPESDMVVTFYGDDMKLARGRHGKRKNGKMAKGGRLKRGGYNGNKK